MGKHPVLNGPDSCEKNREQKMKYRGCPEDRAPAGGRHFFVISAQVIACKKAQSAYLQINSYHTNSAEKRQFAGKSSENSSATASGSGVA